MCEHEVSRERVAYLTGEVARLTRENAALEAQAARPWRVCPECHGRQSILGADGWERCCNGCAGAGTVPPKEDPCTP